MNRGTFYGNQHTLDEELEYEYSDLVRDIGLLATELEKPPTTREAVQDSRLPSIRRMYRLLGDRTWNQMLSEAGAGETQVGEYGEDEKPATLIDIRRVFDRTSAPYLTVRKYEEHGGYNKSVVKRLFGSWSEACEAAGLRAGRKHGRHCEGPGGAMLDSRLELEIANALVDFGVDYVPHRPIPGTGWRCDFYLPQTVYWIEVDGYVHTERPNEDRFRDKLRYYAGKGMNFAVVRGVWDLEPKLFLPE